MKMDQVNQLENFTMKLNYAKINIETEREQKWEHKQCSSEHRYSVLVWSSSPTAEFSLAFKLVVILELETV